MRRDPGPAGCDFYPRSPCGERRSPWGLCPAATKFLSTLSLRRATVVLFVHFCDITISIHALLAESDWRAKAKEGAIGISIHALLAESDHTNKTDGGIYHISIHALLAESDLTKYHFTGIFKISIHALLAESDCPMPKNSVFVTLFLSTLSLRRATR